MSSKAVNTIAGRLSLREPQRESLEILSRITEIISLSKQEDSKTALSIIGSEYPSVTDFEHTFPSMCFALATGVGKTRLMGAFIAYLRAEKGVKNFFVLAPNLTIYHKLIADFTPSTSKYVFKGLEEFAQNPPIVITGDNYETAAPDSLFEGVTINIFNISKINSEVRGGKAPRIKRLSEYIGESYFDYLAKLPDLVLIMDESHRYRASAGIQAINELNPVLGLELTATPFIEASKGQFYFKNIIFHYPLSKAMEDGFVKEPAVVTKKDFDPRQFTDDQIEKIKLEDGIRLHENTKTALETYAAQSNVQRVKPFVLVIAKDTNHAEQVRCFIESERFFEGAYKGKVILLHSNQTGAEKDEFIERLLAVEQFDEPTEIVIHVNMLKEGWDVTNLYTIIPLRAANARTLVEQSIGRGLRLPYGVKTGVTPADRLNIVAHDKFQEIVDEANKPDSPVRITAVTLDPSKDLQKTKTVLAKPNIALKIKPASAADKPMFDTREEQMFAQAVFEKIADFEYLPSSDDLLKEEILNNLAAEAVAVYSAQEPNMPAVDTASLTEQVVKAVIAETIDIPRIIITPKYTDSIGGQTFTLDCSAISYKPVKQALLLQYLRTNEQETLSFQNAGFEDSRLEDYMVRGLIGFEDICYDDHAELLYDLASQLITHLQSYLKSEEDIKNVLQYHQKSLADAVHTQILAHQVQTGADYEVKVQKGFTELRQTAFTAPENAEYLNYRTTGFDKSKIGSYIFTGFEKCLYPLVKFDSDTERRFSAILERDSLKWFKPARGQFQIFYSVEGGSAEYVPDFIAETADAVYMIETKAEHEMSSPEVIGKADAARKWCCHASDLGKKQWKYLLIPHNQVQDNRSLRSYC